MTVIVAEVTGLRGDGRLFDIGLHLPHIKRSLCARSTTLMVTREMIRINAKISPYFSGD